MRIKIRHYAPIWTLLPATLAEPMRRDAKFLGLQQIHAKYYLYKRLRPKALCLLREGEALRDLAKLTD